ncbi:ornithine cyclodeaminase family protein [Nocardia sp. NBC_01009]|uniref:ornithine cyclodeaminase family protein n=1 Tax=Nocardia sp. NBC_01009 TaxID=2975996 RepID=UPI00386F7C50|nr:ornithine cyclodeaminase family protein [Nocardia sp. NBC_01009]
MNDMPLRVLSRNDLADIAITPAEVIKSVRDVYVTLAQGQSRNPAKIALPVPDRDSISYSMLGYDGSRRVVAFKTSYKQEKGRGQKQYYTTITLYDDDSGAPIALMDCARIGSLRTPAATALLVEASAAPTARTALLIGTGTQGRQAFPYLLEVLPNLDRLLLYGTHDAGIAAVLEVFHQHHPDRTIEVVTDVTGAVLDADIVLAASGPATAVKVRTNSLKPGGVLVDVGYGVADSALLDSDYAIATSAGQLAVTGKYLAGPDGTLRPVDAELPEILAGRGLGRKTPEDRVFAYNSGLVVTDIAVGHALAVRAIEEGRGQELRLWN